MSTGREWITGPWRQLHSNPLIVCGGATPIAKAYVSKRGALANARLIAAAPELYEALAAFMHADGHEDFEDEWPAARAALAKARGEKP